jgi:hypothetical protein
MQVAFEPAPGLVGGGNDSGSRGGEVGAALGVGDRRRDELGEVGEVFFRTRGHGLGPGQGGRHDAPEAVVDDDRCPD